MIVFFFFNSAGTVDAWRSSLYPVDWQPGFTDDQGRFLSDFSYAGYHRGEDPIPDVSGPVFNVAQPPYNAVPNDSGDDAPAIQQAINDVQAAGGGVVYLPEGTYYLAPTLYATQYFDPGRPWALLITKDNVVVRGEGPERTRLFYDSTFSKGGGIILISPRPGRAAPGSWDEVLAFDINKGDWENPITSSLAVTQDLLLPTKVIPLAGTSGLGVGDRIIIQAERNSAFLADHNNPNWAWDKGVRYYRTVTAVGSNSITIDAPTRYPLKTAYNTKVYKIHEPIKEVGIENLSLAMLEGPEGDISTARAIEFVNALNCWVRNVKSYPPPENQTGFDCSGNCPDELKYHIHSNGIEIFQSRNITVDNVHLGNPIHKGEGGNGYMFILMGNDNLIRDSSGFNARHTFSFKGMDASGNVIYHCRSYVTSTFLQQKDNYNLWRNTLGSDYHMALSHANLVDNHTLEGDSFSAQFRGGSHSIAAAENVFWNLNIIERLPASDWNYGPFAGITSDQWGWGYVIGARGPEEETLNLYSGNTRYGGGFDNPNPGDSYRPDFYEPASILTGDGQGETLEPQSLYLDQLARRLGSPPASPTPTSVPTLTPTPVPGDVNGDGQVSLSDALLILSAWLTVSDSEDVNGDGQVNGIDFGYVIKGLTF